MNGARMRTVLRWVHIVGGVLIGVFVYAPWGSNTLFELGMQVVVMPVLGLSGALLWQQARFNRFVRRVFTSRHA